MNISKEKSMYEEQMKQMDVRAAQVGQAENPLMGLMRNYVRAKERYDEICHARQQVLQQHTEAEKELQVLSAKVNEVVAQGIYDPTAPQPMPPNSLQNGIYSGQTAAPQRY